MPTGITVIAGESTLQIVTPSEWVSWTSLAVTCLICNCDRTLTINLASLRCHVDWNIETILLGSPVDKNGWRQPVYMSRSSPTNGSGVKSECGCKNKMLRHETESIWVEDRATWPSIILRWYRMYHRWYTMLNDNTGCVSVFYFYLLHIVFHCSCKILFIEELRVWITLCISKRSK